MSTGDSYQNNLRRKTRLITVTDVYMTSKQAFLQKGLVLLTSTTKKKEFHLNNTIVVGVFSVTTIILDNS